MKCPKCGKENNKENSRFCTSCGAKLEQPALEQPKRMNRTKIILLAVICLIIAIGGALSYIIFFDYSPVEVMLLNTNNPGDVLANPQIKNNMLGKEIAYEVCNEAKKGVPVYRIGDGSGPVSVVVAGVHGDQLSSQSAALFLTEYLTGYKIKGTVYVIPFAAPEATEHNTKLVDGVNLNTVANESGTTSNDIVNFVKTHNATAVGDFHGTEPGKNPGKTTIMCSQAPTYESYLLAKDMAYFANDKTMTYTVAGEAYEGAIEDICNLEGIPAVTPLVLSMHGTTTPDALEQSFIQMIALLNANGNFVYDPYTELANYDMQFR